MPSARDSKAKPKGKGKGKVKRKTAAEKSASVRKSKAPAAKSAKKAHSGKRSRSKIDKAAAAKAKPKAKTPPKLKNGAPIVVTMPVKISNGVAKVSQFTATPGLAQGMGANGTSAGKMGQNGTAAFAAKGKFATMSKSKSNGSIKQQKNIVLPPDYHPSEGESFMNEMHRTYFRNKLIAWKDDILKQNMETLKGLHDESAQQADPADRATAETDRALELRARDRQRKLMGKIDAALARIEEGTYGYCEETGEPISLKRLDARPIATLSLEAQERRERRERVFRED